MMNISFRSMDDPYSKEVFEMTKVGLLPFVDEVFGWNDEFQKQRIRDDYKAEWFYWVCYENSKIGYVCFKTYEQALHLHLMLVSTPYLGLGHGKRIMKAIHDIARSEFRDVTLSCFKCNQRAVSLYNSLNYEITEEEEHFLMFRLPHNKNI